MANRGLLDLLLQPFQWLHQLLHTWNRKASILNITLLDTARGPVLTSPLHHPLLVLQIEILVSTFSSVPTGRETCQSFKGQLSVTQLHTERQGAEVSKDVRRQKAGPSRDIRGKLEFSSAFKCLFFNVGLPIPEWASPGPS